MMKMIVNLNWQRMGQNQRQFQFRKRKGQHVWKFRKGKPQTQSPKFKMKTKKCARNQVAWTEWSPGATVAMELELDAATGAVDAAEAVETVETEVFGWASAASTERSLMLSLVVTGGTRPSVCGRRPLSARMSLSNSSSCISTAHQINYTRFEVWFILYEQTLFVGL